VAEAASEPEAAADETASQVEAPGETEAAAEAVTEGDAATESPAVAEAQLESEAPAEAMPATVAASGGDGSEPEVEVDVNARLAGGGRSNAKQQQNGECTQVMVVGLVSVASIAAFKRQLSKLPGVRSVGVSSGPDGEFVFTANHTADTFLAQLVPELPGFQARVMNQRDGVMTVSAHDPETEG